MGFYYCVSVVNDVLVTGLVLGFIVTAIVTLAHDENRGQNYKHNSMHEQAFLILTPLVSLLFVLLYLPSMAMLAIGSETRTAKFIGWGLVLRIVWQAVGNPLVYMLGLEIAVHKFTLPISLGQKEIVSITFLFLIAAFGSMFATRVFHVYFVELGGTTLWNVLTCQPEPHPDPYIGYDPTPTEEVEFSIIINNNTDTDNDDTSGT